MLHFETESGDQIPLKKTVRIPKSIMSRNNISKSRIMKKVTSILGVIIVALAILTSCGGGNDTVNLTLDKVTITGDANDYMEVVPGSYELKKVKATLGEDLQIGLKFKVTNSFDQNEITENTSIGNISLQFTDKDGTPIDYDFRPAGTADYDKLKSLLKGKPGDIVTVLFHVSGFTNDDKNSEVLKNAKGVEITNADITNPKSESIIDNSASSSEEETSSSDASGDCEQFCSDYEAFADEYVALMKKYKANPSDPTILSEYTEMLSTASDMEKSSKDCSADPNAAARISKALAKIAKAAY